MIFCGNENPDVELDSEVVARGGEENAWEMEAEGEERTLGRRVEEEGEVTAKEGSENGFFSNPTPSSSTQTLSEKSKS